MIAFVSQPFDGVLPPCQNSIGIYINEIAQRLSERFEVHVVTAAWQERPQPTRAGEVTYHYLSLWPEDWLGRVVARFRPETRPDEFLRQSYARGYSRQAARVLRQVDCQVAHLFNFSQFGPVIRRHNPDLKLVLQMRCEWLSQLDREQIRENLANFDVVLGCSRHITDQAASRFPELDLQFETIYNGIDTTRFEFRADLADTDSKQILFVGRISPEKGIHTLIDAFALARRQDPDLQLCLVGGHKQLPASLLVDLSADELVGGLRRFYTKGTPEEYWQIIQDTIHAKGLEECVTLPGNLSYDEVVGYFQSSVILVNPSLSESFGRAPAEAAAIGLPVVATRVGGLVEVVCEEEAGILVDPDQPEALADAILRLTGDRNLRRCISAAARQRMLDKFSWRTVGEQVAQLSQSLLTTSQA